MSPRMLSPKHRQTLPVFGVQETIQEICKIGAFLHKPLGELDLRNPLTNVCQLERLHLCKHCSTVSRGAASGLATAAEAVLAGAAAGVAAGVAAGGGVAAGEAAGAPPALPVSTSMRTEPTLTVSCTCSPGNPWTRTARSPTPFLA